MNEITQTQILIAAITLSLTVNLVLACCLIRQRKEEIRRIVSFSFETLLTVEERIQEITWHIKNQSEWWIRAEFGGMHDNTAPVIQGVDSNLISDLNRINRVSGCRSVRELASSLNRTNQFLLQYLDKGKAGAERGLKVLQELEKAIPLIAAAKETALSKITL